MRMTHAFSAASFFFSNIFDARDAGTTFRFLAAYLAFKEGECVLTGSDRMRQRPIGDLVNALKQTRR